MICLQLLCHFKTTPINVNIESTSKHNGIKLLFASLLIRSRHTSPTLCGGCVVGCGQSVVASHTWPAPWLQGPATKLWHHNLTTKPATFLVGLWCKCGGCVGQLCGGVVVGLWACTPPHPPHTIATPALPHSSCFRPPHFMFNVSPPPHPTPRTH